MFDWLKNLFGGPKPTRAPEELPKPSDAVVQLVRDGQKIAAIKLYREQNAGVGLKEAKDAVDRLG